MHVLSALCVLSAPVCPECSSAPSYLSLLPQLSWDGHTDPPWLPAHSALFLELLILTLALALPGTQHRSCL